jgi:glyoxylase-like metal-dependent hydrolase (beta-lactamase superfamily II)
MTERRETDAEPPTDAAAGNSELGTRNAARYQRFHQQGRWHGLPLRVEDTGELPHFEPVIATTHPASRIPHPDVLVFGVPNHGMMAGQPTNVLLLGHVADESRALTLVDSGDASGREVLVDAIANSGVDIARIGQIVLTHCHPDHVGNAQAVKAASGAPVWAHVREREQIARWGDGLVVDHWIDGDGTIACDGFALETLFTPGHSPGHVCVVESASRVLIAGDMISGFGSVGIFPPSGSMAAYIDSLRKLQAAYEANPFAAVCPGHGPVIPDARAKIAEYIEHRLQREVEVLAAVERGLATIDAMLPVVYPDVLPHLAFAARSTLQAHLDKLVDDGRILKLTETRYAVR